MFVIVNGCLELKKLGYFHTDIKLENLLINPEIILSEDKNLFFNSNFNYKKIIIKLTDLSSIEKIKKWHRHIATTRYYRAPEILLGSRWGFEADIWSIGCLLVELLIGKIPFEINEEIIQIFLIQQMIGPIPKKIINDSQKIFIKNFIKNDYLDINNFNLEIQNFILSKPNLFEILPNDFIIQDLIFKLLNPDPFKRIHLEELLSHPYFFS